MYISNLPSKGLSDAQMNNLLFRNIKDDYEVGDCIFVSGSNKAVQYRLLKAVQLYKEGKAGKILFSGEVRWEGTNFPEAIM